VRLQGKVMTWGGSDRGQCGHGRITNTLTPTVVTGGDIENAFAVRVSCGYNTTGVTARSSQGLQNGDEEGGVWMFGAGDLGQLGLGSEGDCLLPVRVEGLRGHDAEEVIINPSSSFSSFAALANSPQTHTTSTPLPAPRIAPPPFPFPPPSLSSRQG
jgi:alpha-tubulin suppressor-like RCC1 family protein